MPGNDAQLQIRIPPEETLYGGIFETWAYAKKGDTVPHRFAVNVDPVESNLSPAESTQVLEALRPVEATWRKAEELDAAEINASGFNRSLLLMCVLIVLLLGEQWLAYSASYHAKPGVSS